MHKRPSVALRGGLDVSQAAEVARRALRAFLALSPDKRSLSEWLLGPYLEATGFAPRHHASVPSRPESEPPPGPLMGVAELMEDAKFAVREAMSAALGPQGSEKLIRLLPPVVHVMAAHDIYGGHGFIPMDLARTRLTDRVLSLVVADYLTRPDDFVVQIPTWFGHEGRRLSGVVPRHVDVPDHDLPKVQGT